MKEKKLQRILNRLDRAQMKAANQVDWINDISNSIVADALPQGFKDWKQAISQGKGVEGILLRVGETFGWKYPDSD